MTDTLNSTAVYFWARKVGAKFTHVDFTELLLGCNVDGSREVRCDVAVNVPFIKDCWLCRLSPVIPIDHLFPLALVNVIIAKVLLF